MERNRVQQGGRQRGREGGGGRKEGGGAPRKGITRTGLANKEHQNKNKKTGNSSENIGKHVLLFPQEKNERTWVKVSTGITV